MEVAMDILETIVSKLKGEPRVVVFTGAGVSAESGIPTFRDKLDGLWSKFSAEELASAKGFKANPKLVWEWYAWRRKIILDAEPNRAHQAILAYRHWCLSLCCFIRYAMRHMPRRHVLTRRIAMTHLVIKKDVGAERFQKHPFVQATQEQRFVNSNIPGSQGSDHPFVRRRAPGGHEGCSYR